MITSSVLKRLNVKLDFIRRHYAEQFFTVRPLNVDGNQEGKSEQAKEWGCRLIILIDCMIFPLPFLDFTRMSISSFFPRPASFRISVCIECFPLTDDLNGCKTRINRHLLTVGSRPWHDARTIARVRAITRTNQKGGLGGRWKARPKINLRGLILPTPNAKYLVQNIFQLI